MVLRESTKRPKASYFLQEQEQNGEGKFHYYFFFLCFFFFFFFCMKVLQLVFSLCNKTEFLRKSNDSNRQSCNVGSGGRRVHPVA